MNNKILRTLTISLIIIAGINLYSCKKHQKATPKPRGYFRIDMPKRNYLQYDYTCPYKFEYPEYSIVFPGKSEHPCWLNLYFPLNDATIYFTYKNINGNLEELTEDARTMVYKHTIKAEAINEIAFENDSLKTYGILYDIKGNVASSLQFFITDSTSHFLRGALYFNTRPNKDSIAPVLSYIREDIIHLIESTEWK